MGEHNLFTNNHLDLQVDWLGIVVGTTTLQEYLFYFLLLHFSKISTNLNVDTQLFLYHSSYILLINILFIHLLLLHLLDLIPRLL
jgi:hypothetical protein